MGLQEAPDKYPEWPNKLWEYEPVVVREDYDLK